VTEAWTSRVPGKRFGWTKERAVICVHCMDEKRARRMLGIVDVQFKRVEQLIPRKKKVT
jgi:hypothetical protein